MRKEPIQVIMRYFLVGVAAAALASTVMGCEHFPEATFRLASESRLPKWFAIPPGLARADVSITMNYYVTPSGRTASFVLQNSKGTVLKKLYGSGSCDRPFTPKNPPQGYPSGYPAYERVTVNGMTEMIEHRKMEPIFYISDDAAIEKDFAETGCR